MSSQYCSMHHRSIAPPSRTTREGGAARLRLNRRRRTFANRGRHAHAVAIFAAAVVLGAGCSDDAGSPPSSMAGAPASIAGQMALGAAGTGGSAAASAPGVAGALPQAGTEAAATGKLSFATDIFPKVIRAKCSACHSDAPNMGGLAFFPGAETAYKNLVNVPAGNEETYKCKGIGLMRVQPGDPDKSLIYLKLTNPPCGSKMPPGMFGMATPEQVELVRQWIAEGAAP